MSQMNFILSTRQGQTPLSVEYNRVFAIGYAGRNQTKILEHIRELERDLGVPAPKRLPTIFQCGNYLLTQEEKVAVVGEKTSGEVEAVLVVQKGRLYVGLGSDHTDRELEAVNIPRAKQICPKPICPILWEYEEVKDHWDQIALLSWQTVEGKEIAYQAGTLADVLKMETILRELEERVGGIDDCVIFSGTVPVLQGFHFGSHFRYEMRDEVLGRSLKAQYAIEAVPLGER